MFEEAFGYASRHPYLGLWKKRGGFGMVDAHNNYASSSPAWPIFLNHPLVRPHLNSFLAETHNLLLDRSSRTLFLGPAADTVFFITLVLLDELEQPEDVAHEAPSIVETPSENMVKLFSQWLDLFTEDPAVWDPLDRVIEQPILGASFQYAGCQNGIHTYYQIPTKLLLHLDDAGGCYVWKEGQFFPSNLQNELKLIEDFSYTLDPGVFLSRFLQPGEARWLQALDESPDTLGEGIKTIIRTPRNRFVY